MAYDVLFSQKALRDLKKLPEHVAVRIIDGLESIKESPFFGSVENIISFNTHHRKELQVIDNLFNFLDCAGFALPSGMGFIDKEQNDHPPQAACSFVYILKTIEKILVEAC